MQVRRARHRSAARARSGVVRIASVPVRLHSSRRRWISARRASSGGTRSRNASMLPRARAQSPSWTSVSASQRYGFGFSGTSFCAASSSSCAARYSPFSNAAMPRSRWTCAAASSSPGAADAGHAASRTIASNTARISWHDIARRRHAHRRTLPIAVAHRPRCDQRGVCGRAHAARRPGGHQAATPRAGQRPRLHAGAGRGRRAGP